MEYTINELKLCKVIDSYLTMKFPDLNMREVKSYDDIDIYEDNIVYIPKEAFEDTNLDVLVVSIKVWRAMTSMFSTSYTEDFLKMWFENKYNLNVDWVDII
jgi:hypothetical protein